MGIRALKMILLKMTETILKAITEVDPDKTKQEIVKELNIEYSIDICIKFENQKA